MRRLQCYPAVLVFAMLMAVTPSLAARQAPKRILYLSTEGLNHQYFGAAYAAFKDQLDLELPNQTIIDIEPLDIIKFPSPEYRAALVTLMHTRYKGIKHDAVVTAGTPALRFAAETAPWNALPTYFSNANDAVVRSLPLPPNFSGQTFTIHARQTMELIRQILPRTRRVLLIGNAPEADIYRPQLSKELAALDSRFEFIDLRGKQLDEVLNAVATAPDDSVIYRVGFSRDGAGRSYDSFAVLSTIIAKARRPIFVEYSIFIGMGVLGGVAIDPEPQSRAAARQIAAMLRGQDITEMPRTAIAFKPTFDWRELQRWHIDRASLPPDSQVWHYAPTVWERYRWEIAGTAALIAFLSFLVLALLVERRRRALAVAESRARLAEIAHLNRNATAMVYSGAIAHELNQPLAAILSNTQAAQLVLNMEPPRLDQLREILEDIERDDQRASELIRGMRGLLKRGESTQELLELNSVVSKGVLFIRPEARVRGVTLRMNLHEETILVRGDRVQLQQTLINLVINAMDAMADLAAGGRFVDIVVCPDGAQLVTVSVIDAGPGFDCDIAQVFRSFTTTKQHGTGLGLAITAALVREHGGSIAAVNLPQGGACVTITLPRVLPESPAES
jgi:signal transduction histidine kinase